MPSFFMKTGAFLYMAWNDSFIVQADERLTYTWSICIELLFLLYGNNGQRKGKDATEVGRKNV